MKIFIHRFLHFPRIRRARAGWRDTIVLLREFFWPLTFFIAVIVLGGLLFYELSARAGQPLATRAEAIYTVLALTFLESPGVFPDIWYLELFYFLMPLIGIGILAQGLAEFGFLFFNRRSRSKEWEMAVASTFNRHIVLIGLGHLGFRVLQTLYELDQDVVVVELKPEKDLVARARAMGVPVIEDDGQREETLLAANVPKARAILLCTQNDSLNLKVALKARRLKPDIRVILRIFEDDFAQSLQEQFGFRAMSATGMSAPAFAAAAAGVDITRPITVEGESFSLARLDVKAVSKLNGRSLAYIEQSYDLSIVLLRHDGESDFHPAGDRQLHVGDVLAVLGGQEQISRLVNDNR